MMSEGSACKAQQVIVPSCKICDSEGIACIVNWTWLQVVSLRLYDAGYDRYGPVKMSKEENWRALCQVTGEVMECFGTWFENEMKLTLISL